MLSSGARRKNVASSGKEAMKKPNDRTAPAADPIQVIYAASSGEVLAFAAGEMSRGLQKMLGPEPITVAGSYDLTWPQLGILLGRRAPQPSPEPSCASYSLL